MSRDFDHKIAIFENLPSGGAKELFLSNLTALSKYRLTRYTEKSWAKNIIVHMKYVLIDLWGLHKGISQSINKHDLAIFYHTWLTKSPYSLRLTKIPKIYFCHEPPREYYDKEHIRSQTFKERLINFIRLPIKHIDAKNVQNSNAIVVANSKHSKAVIDKIYNVKSLVIYPGIDTQRIRKVKVRSKANQVISVGAVNKLKGFDFLIKVIGNINYHNRPSLVIVGNGGDARYITELKALASKLRVHLDIKLNIAKEDLIKEYKKSKVFLYSPINEPFGIVVLEAMAAGLPLVVYQKGGGYSEIISRKNGAILNDLDARMWAKKLNIMLASPDKLINIGQNNEEFVLQYDKKIMNNKILNLVNSLVSL